MVGNRNLTIGYELRPVRGEQPVQRNVQTARQQDVGVDEQPKTPAPAAGVFVRLKRFVSSAKCNA
jgi:hypothetical protein